MGHTPSHLTVRHGVVSFEAIRVTVAAKPNLFTATQKAEFKLISDLEGTSVVHVFIELFKMQVNVKKMREMRPSLWIFRQLLWHVMGMIEKRLIGRSAYSRDEHPVCPPLRVAKC